MTDRIDLLDEARRAIRAAALCKQQRLPDAKVRPLGLPIAIRWRRADGGGETVLIVQCAQGCLAFIAARAANHAVEF